MALYRKLSDLFPEEIKRMSCRLLATPERNHTMETTKETTLSAYLRFKKKNRLTQIFIVLQIFHIILFVYYFNLYSHSSLIYDSGKLTYIVK